MGLSTTPKERGRIAQRPQLRLLRGGRRGAAASGHGAARGDSDAFIDGRDASDASVVGDTGATSTVGRGAGQLAREHSRILVAGADPVQRAAVLRDLSEALPPDAEFGEAGAAWEVLEQAPSSGVVMLAGDLDEVTAESLMHVLGHRYPRLPVVALCGPDGGEPIGVGQALEASIGGPTGLGQAVYTGAGEPVGVGHAVRTGAGGPVSVGHAVRTGAGGPR